MADALDNLQKLPPFCYAVLNREAVTIARGAPHPLKAAIGKDDVVRLNQELGISPQQQRAMLAGIQFGWTSDAADPDHQADQVPDEEPAHYRKYTVSVPFVAMFDVVAFDENAALYAADVFILNAELPDWLVSDGPTNILNEEET